MRKTSETIKVCEKLLRTFQRAHLTVDSLWQCVMVGERLCAGYNSSFRLPDDPIKLLCCFVSYRPIDATVVETLPPNSTDRLVAADAMPPTFAQSTPYATPLHSTTPSLLIHLLQYSRPHLASFSFCLFYTISNKSKCKSCRGPWIN